MTPESDEPVACTLPTDELQARRGSLLPALATDVQSVRETGDGFEFEFAASTGILAKLVEVIDAERQCCRFLKFELIVEPAGGPIRLRLSGPPGTREFLSSLLP